jgi:hypothetical protein
MSMRWRSDATVTAQRVAVQLTAGRSTVRAVLYPLNQACRSGVDSKRSARVSFAALVRGLAGAIRGDWIEAFAAAVRGADSGVPVWSMRVSTPAHSNAQEFAPEKSTDMEAVAVCRGVLDAHRPKELAGLRVGGQLILNQPVAISESNARLVRLLSTQHNIDADIKAITGSVMAAAPISQSWTI